MTWRWRSVSSVTTNSLLLLVGSSSSSNMVAVCAVLTQTRYNRAANGQSRVRADTITGWRARDTTRREIIIYTVRVRYRNRMHLVECGRCVCVSSGVSRYPVHGITLCYTIRLRSRCTLVWCVCVCVLKWTWREISIFIMYPDIILCKRSCCTQDRALKGLCRIIHLFVTRWCIILQDDGSTYIGTSPVYVYADEDMYRYGLRATLGLGSGAGRILYYYYYYYTLSVCGRK